MMLKLLGATIHIVHETIRIMNMCHYAQKFIQYTFGKFLKYLPVMLFSFPIVMLKDYSIYLS